MFESQVSGKNGARRRNAFTAFGSGKGGSWEIVARHLGHGCNTPGGPAADKKSWCDARNTAPWVAGPLARGV